MKVYKYNGASGVFVCELQVDTSRTFGLLPAHTTTKVPPNVADDMQAVYSETLGIWTVKPKPVKVPAEVSMWKAKSVIALRGYSGQVEHELALLAEPEVTVAKLKWQHATVIARSDALVSYMAAKFGWDAEYVDGMFIEAAQLK